MRAHQRQRTPVLPALLRGAQEKQRWRPRQSAPLPSLQPQLQANRLKPGPQGAELASSGVNGRAGGLTLGCLPKLARASSGLRAATAAKSMRGTTFMVARCGVAIAGVGGRVGGVGRFGAEQARRAGGRHLPLAAHDHLGHSAA